MYSKSMNRAAECRKLMPKLFKVEHELIGNQIKRDVAIFKDFATGGYTYESLGQKYNKLRGSRISQIVKKVEYQIKNPNQPDPQITDQTLWRRNRNIYEKWCTGEYSIYDLSTKYNLTEARINQIIKDVTRNEELRRAREDFNEPLISEMVKR